MHAYMHTYILICRLACKYVVKRTMRINTCMYKNTHRYTSHRTALKMPFASA